MRTWLALLVSRSVKMAALIVVERSPHTLHLQLELARADERKVQAEKERLQAGREMMRVRVELGFHGEVMSDAGAFAAKSLPEIKFQKMVEQTNDVLSFFLMFLKRLVLSDPTLLDAHSHSVLRLLDHNQSILTAASQ